MASQNLSLSRILSLFITFNKIIEILCTKNNAFDYGKWSLWFYISFNCPVSHWGTLCTCVDGNIDEERILVSGWFDAPYLLPASSLLCVVALCMHVYMWLWPY